jgi:hypothetical protein
MGLRPSEEEEEEERDCETQAQDTRSAEEQLSAVVRANDDDEEDTIQNKMTGPFQLRCPVPPKRGKIKDLNPKGFRV